MNNDFRPFGANRIIDAERRLATCLQDTHVIRLER